MWFKAVVETIIIKVSVMLVHRAPLNNKPNTWCLVRAIHCSRSFRFLTSVKHIYFAKSFRKS